MKLLDVRIWTRAVAVLVVVAAMSLVVLDILIVEFFGPFIVIPLALVPLALVGALLIARIPGNAVGWLLAGSGLLFQATFAGGAYAWAALVRDPGVLRGGEIAAVVGNAAFAPALGLAVLMLLFFPSGHGLGGRWTWIERAVVLVAILIACADFLKDAPISVALPLDQGTGVGSVIANPLAPHGLPGAIVAGIAWISDSTTIPIVLIGPLSLFVRYRRSTRIEREQIKWLAYSGTLAFSLIVTSNFVSGPLSNLVWAGGVMALGTLPIAIAIAIFRYRLYDIDVLIRRTLIYVALSAVLIAAYIGGVALFETVLAPFTAGNGISVAISTLAVVALFQPLRRRIQRAVDRRFYRQTYDAGRTLDAFSARLRDQIDLASLERELLGAVSETVQPAKAGVWLRR